jgi:hypothetical protein
MHDYDVEALGLITPPASAVVTPYRPAVQIRNNGVHNVLASGNLRIYAADLLVFETELYSNTIAPGETGLAQAVDYWTPPTEGKYMIFGKVSCPLDQYEPNDHFGPVTITVTGLPPPTPPTVPLHASQHEEGGKDEVSIDGLHGLTADPQLPLPHVAAHQAAGIDQLNVGGLLGELAADQPTKVHSNSKHDPQMATATQMSQHQAATSVHTSSSNLEQKANKGIANGYAGLDANVVVPVVNLGIGSEPGGTDASHFLARDRIWREVPSGYTIPQGLICIWNLQSPIPIGWHQVEDVGVLPLPYIYILYNPSQP